MSIVAERCNWCSKQRLTHRLHRLQSGQAICDHCLEWHLRGLDLLGGNLPPGCQECERTIAELTSIPGRIGARFYVVPKDGIYQVLCEDCITPYTSKRADLYRGTRYGNELNL